METTTTNPTEPVQKWEGQAPKCSRGWEDRCREAKGRTCLCACGGVNHGKTVPKPNFVTADPGGKSLRWDEKQSVFSEEMPFLGLHNFPSRCGLTIHERGGKALVILTELPDNPGTSVTNAIEKIATKVYREHLSGYSPSDITWIEHYQRGKEPDTFDLVTLMYYEGSFHTPSWLPLELVNREQIEQRFLPQN